MALDVNAVQRLLTEAKEAVDAAGIPDDLRPVAFERALDLLAGTAAAGAGHGQADVRRDEQEGDTRLAVIARRMGVDAAKLVYVYDLDDEDVNIVIPRSKLSSAKANATREVALLYSAARQAGGYDETHTSVSAIRRRADDMGVLDTANFATHVRNIDGLSVRGQTAQTREFKVTQHGYEEAGRLVARLTGGAS